MRIPSGIKVRLDNEQDAKSIFQWVSSQLEGILAAGELVTTSNQESAGCFAGLRLSDSAAGRCAPGGDTTLLRQKFKLNPDRRRSDLNREILLAMLVSPIPYVFPSLAELKSAVRIRCSIVQAATRTKLAFAAYEAERPANFWSYDEDRGFLLRPGRSLIAGLEKATQTTNADRMYTFSCRRATEYIVLLGVTREAIKYNPALFERVSQQAETRALKGAEFERTFVRNLGSPETPLPLRFFVPGDRTWFRNPDPVSADVTGYEGSWTFYLGGGLFADFWNTDNVFSLESKAVCVFHWRNATYRDHDGELQVDEAKVKELVEQSLADREETSRILDEMLRLQEPLGTSGGGIIEPHREHPCHIHPETADVVLPDIH